MRVIVAGGRDFVPGETSAQWLETKLKELDCTEELCGDARGADKFGAEIAERLGIKIRHFPPDWDHFGKSAGFRRNVEMANNADILIAFPGGKGTRHMIEIAKEKGLMVVLAPGADL